MLKKKKENFSHFFSVNIAIPQEHREIKKKTQGLNMEKDKNIKMIEFIKNIDDNLQVIDALFFKKGYKVQNL